MLYMYTRLYIECYVMLCYVRIQTLHVLQFQNNGINIVDDLIIYPLHHNLITPPGEALVLFTGGGSPGDRITKNKQRLN